MRLTTRLMLLMLLCMAPMMAALIYTQIVLRERRSTDVEALALRQAELANADLDSILEGGRQLLLAVAGSSVVVEAGPGCDERLAGLAENLPAYQFLAVADVNGRIRCASTPVLLNRSATTWLDNLAREGFSPGLYSTQAGIAPPFLPLGLWVKSNAPAGDAGPRVIVAALNLSWLGRHLEQMEMGRAGEFQHSRITALDRAGTAIARYPDPGEWLGKPGPDGMRALVNRPAMGVARLGRPGGPQYIAGYVPDVPAPAGITIVAALFPSDLLGEIDRLAIPEAVLIGLSTLLAAAAAALYARHVILRPIGSLLTATARWRRGDLTARANLDESGEFGALAKSFDAMAETLELREQESQQHAETLETRVAERTRELSDSNNRLQVEIAERARSQVALQEGQKLQAVGQLAGGVAHDFNNLLATVLGSLELIQHRMSTGNVDRERINALVKRASDAVQRGAQLTSRLLAFSRRQRLEPRPADLNQLVNELLGLAGSTIGRRVRTRLELAPQLWPALADPGQVEAALLNLCLNARDAVTEGGGELLIRTSNEILTASDDGLPAGRYVCIAVIDTGAGMTPEVLRRAVDPFFTTKGPGCSGLGLSQAYGLARQSGGTLRLRSTPGLGTEVSLLLPWAGEESGRVAAPADSDQAVRPAPVIRVLLVDDDPAVRQVTADMLHNLGCTVVEAASGVEALRLVQGTTPDLLVLDYAMPGMNGLRLAHAMRDAGVSAPVLLATGYAELERSEETTTAVLDAILRKPFTLRELAAAIKRLLNRPAEGSNVVELRRLG
jgi:signal transduction histidine kinase/ActR/RegA family two-component response regulator